MKRLVKIFCKFIIDLAQIKSYEFWILYLIVAKNIVVLCYSDDFLGNFIVLSGKRKKCDEKMPMLAVFGVGVLLAQNAVAGASYLKYQGYKQLLQTPSGNIVCGGDPMDSNKNTLFCYVHRFH